MLYFEWDETKARENLEKHGISFDAAALVLKIHSLLRKRIKSVKAKKDFEPLACRNVSL